MLTKFYKQKMCEYQPEKVTEYIDEEVKLQ